MRCISITEYSLFGCPCNRFGYRRSEAEERVLCSARTAISGSITSLTIRRGTHPGLCFRLGSGTAVHDMISKGRWVACEKWHMQSSHNRLKMHGTWDGLVIINPIPCKIYACCVTASAQKWTRCSRQTPIKICRHGKKQQGFLARPFVRGDWLHSPTK